MQKSHGCENISDGDVLESLHGAALLGVCLAAVIGSVLLCVVISICCRGMRTPVKNPQPATTAVGSQTFTTTSPRRTPMPTAAVCSSPYSQHQQQQQLSALQPMIANDYGYPHDNRMYNANSSDYNTYYKNPDGRTTLLRDQQY
jgi:hypothetical protein